MTEDFNLIIEEAPFYYMITTKMQTELVNLLFKGGFTKFHHFFSQCEQGFLNEIIVSMSMRRMFDDEEIFLSGFKIEEVVFVREGAINLETN